MPRARKSSADRDWRRCCGQRRLCQTLGLSPESCFLLLTFVDVPFQVPKFLPGVGAVARWSINCGQWSNWRKMSPGCPCQCTPAQAREQAWCRYSGVWCAMFLVVCSVAVIVVGFVRLCGSLCLLAVSRFIVMTRASICGFVCMIRILKYQCILQLQPDQQREIVR